MKAMALKALPITTPVMCGDSSWHCVLVFLSGGLTAAASEASMTPGELFIDEGQHVLNPDRRTATIVVQNTAIALSKWDRTTTLQRQTQPLVSIAK